VAHLGRSPFEAGDARRQYGKRLVSLRRAYHGGPGRATDHSVLRYDWRGGPWPWGQRRELLYRNRATAGNTQSRRVNRVIDDSV
jgi:hypothetical protein